MKPITHLFCKSATEMVPYSPIEPPDQIANRLGLKEEDIIKLDANENPYGTSQEVIAALAEQRYYHIYPDPAQVQLRQAISAYAGVDTGMIIAGTGADEIIDIACRLLLEPGDKVLSFTPTFSYYSHIIALNRGIYMEIPREADFSISVEKARKIDLARCKLVILCSPNNPSGNLVSEEVLDYFLNQDLVVMLDEAYFEFSAISHVSKLKNHNNLLVLRTFSKCFGMAGLRVGYGLGSSELISAMMKIKPPFSVNVAAEAALKVCLENLSFYRNQVQKIIDTREWTINQLKTFKQLKVFDSSSNFILCRVEGFEAAQLCKELEKTGILLRYFGTSLLKDCIRVSVGTANQMSIFIKRLATFIR
ncbi:MAG: histidinol-phosphate transaminase [Proteobacteria bacterium]|nr:histidinol-phosphate transaminase [Pseudomonadota bacterium]